MAGKKEGGRWLDIVLFCTLALAACGGAEPLPPPSLRPTPAPAILNVGVATGAVPLAELVAESYVEETERATVHFVPGNSETLITDLEEGRLDAILIHHIPAGSEFWFNPVALDGLALAVQADNRVKGLNRAEIQAIFNGRIESWNDVGGARVPVTLLGREPGAGTRALFNQRIMAEQRSSIRMRVLPNDGELLEAVAAEPGAIGYTTMGAAAGAPGVRLLAVDGILPTPNSTGTQNYPLTTPIYFVTREEPAGPSLSGAEVRALLSWLQSPAGQERIGEKYGRVG